jgi:arylsulfatase A-like enzyme
VVSRSVNRSFVYHLKGGTVTKKFNGVINLDVRDSQSDWAPYALPQNPEGSPNVLIVLYDDTGMAAWSPYGGKINMPTLQKLADNGLMYSQWHTTALCSPTRSCFLTGRNHHQNASSCITEGADGYPGSNGHIPADCGPLARVMQDNGYNTYWLGKNHNVPVDELALGGPKQHWPLNQGWDRFYGFFGGETNQYYPTLMSDNHMVEQPSLPEDGYHLSKDLADQAITMLKDARQTNPSRPFYMWFCPGANHAPHQVPQEWADKYKGQFDDGYEAYREWVLPRMIERGLLPADTVLTPMNPLGEEDTNPGDMVRPWDTLSADEKRLFARMAEVYAGFSEYTDYQVGRVIEFLETTGQLDNTLVIYAADNGASGEGSPNGSVNENKFFNGYPDELAENMKLIDELGGPSTYEHYPTGWAMAFSTPFKMYKRYSYSGGTCDPLVISWPKGIKSRGEVRNQYHHVIDIVPTILECTGLTFPEQMLGVDQTPLPGVSMKYSFDAADAPTQKRIQYYTMLGTRALWQDGWKAVTTHAPISGKGNFDKDVWELYHVDSDRAEGHNLAQENPGKVQEMIALWFAEAGKYNVLPLDDRTPPELLAMERPKHEAPRDTYIYFPDAAEVPEAEAVSIIGRSYKILANVTIEDADAHGVIFSHGSRFGGHSLFVKNRKLYYVYNFLGIPPEQQLVSSTELKPGKYTVGMEFAKEGHGEYNEALGTARLFIDEKQVAEGKIRTQPANFMLSGDGLCIGRDSGDPVSKEYTSGSEFTGGEIQAVAVNISDDVYLSLEKHAAAAMARD